MAISSNISITQNSQNIANNKSNITVRVQVTTTGESYNGYSKPGTCTINGTPYDFSHNIPYQATTTIFEKTLDVAHDSNGKKTVYASFSFQTGISAGTITGSTSKKLTTIPRTSEVSSSKKNFNIGETITIYTNRKSASFTHTAVIKFNGQTVRTQTGIDASYSWNTNELFAKIPNQNQANGTVELTTYSGGTRIGTSAVNFTGYVVNSDPVFNNFDCEDTNTVTKTLTGNNQKYIRKYSNLKVTITSANKMTTKNSATPKYYNIVVGNKIEKLDYSTSEISKTINNMDDNTVTVFAVDSRGNQKDKTKALDIVEYSETVLQSVKIERKEGVGETVLISLSGKYANINFGAKTNTVKSIQFRKKSKTDTEFGSWVEIKQLVTIDTENGTFSCASKEITGQTFTLGTEYDIEVQVKDELSSDTEPVSLNSGKVLLSALKNKGISVGGIYNENLGGPLQLDNKNVINWINSKQDKQKHILKAILATDNITITSSKDYDAVLVPLGEQYLKFGDKLSLSNGKIVIGSGVKYIRISAQVMMSYIPSSLRVMGLAVYITNSQVYTNYGIRTSSDFLTYNAPGMIFPAKAGDTVSIHVYIEPSGTSVKLRKYSQSTFLQVEVIE
jgi:ribosomal protein L14E/L6E/L27E